MIGQSRSAGRGGARIVRAPRFSRSSSRSMQKEGPPLQQLLHRITATPPDFMAEPRIGNKGEVHTVAVVRDLLASKGHEVDISSLSTRAGRDVKVDRNRLSITLLMTWLLADPALTIEHERLADIL